ncbi:hypothetical protein ACC754_40990, partial [Rhizobium johnstonii]
IVVLPVQINGKKRSELTISRDADQNTVTDAVLDLDAERKAAEARITAMPALRASLKAISNDNVYNPLGNHDDLLRCLSVQRVLH